MGIPFKANVGDYNEIQAMFAKVGGEVINKTLFHYDFQQS